MSEVTHWALRVSYCIRYALTPEKMRRYCKHIDAGRRARKCVILLGIETADQLKIFVFMHYTAFLENRYDFIPWNFPLLRFGVLIHKNHMHFRKKLIVKQQHIGFESFD